MVDQTFFLQMVRLNEKAEFGFSDAVENCKYWLFKYLAIIDQKSLRGVYLLMNWKESYSLTLLIASGYFF